MSSGFYRKAVDEGLLVAHEEIEPEVVPTDGTAFKILRPEQIPFISYPYEWSFSQLQDAALLTLRLHLLALDHGLWLKDASAYNVQFHQGRPLFIDSLSFEPYPEGQPWVAYQQFCRHFLAPLALMAYRHADLVKLLRVHIDGVPLELASMLLPARTRFSVSLSLHIHVHARFLRKHADRPESAARAKSRGMGKNALLGLVDGLKSGVRRLKWEPKGTEWGDYYEGTNYTRAAEERKAALVAELVDAAGPASVWDLGANTGRFSRIAADKGIRTVAFDVDPAAVEKNYRDVRAGGEENLLPLVMDLTNPSTDLGWGGRERMSLRRRAPVDLVMALALVHHLAISNNVPLERIADFLAGLARQVIIEFVPKEDSQVQRLLATREDIFPDYTLAGFERAFSERFVLRQALPIPETVRVLHLFERR